MSRRQADDRASVSTIVYTLCETIHGQFVDGNVYDVDPARCQERGRLWTMSRDIETTEVSDEYV